MSRVRLVESRANDTLKALRRLLHDPAGYRKTGRAWLEGDHLCRALLEHGGQPTEAVVTATAWQQPAWRRLAEAAPEITVIPDAAMQELSGLESPAPMAFLVAVPPAVQARAGVRTVVLDRLQDPGNAGSILRTAAAMGFRQVVALKGSVALWSPKVLRAGMGAHFGLTLVEGASAQGLRELLGVPLVATHLQAAQPLHAAALPDPLAWVMGHEGHGVADNLAAACDLRVVIPQPGGEESLNVAAAAAICLYETARRAGGPALA